MGGAWRSSWARPEGCAGSGQWWMLNGIQTGSDAGKVDTPDFTGLAGVWAEQAGVGPLLGHQCPSGLREDGRWCLSMWGACEVSICLWLGGEK